MGCSCWIRTRAWWLSIRAETEQRCLFLLLRGSGVTLYLSLGDFDYRRTLVAGGGLPLANVPPGQKAGTESYSAGPFDVAGICRSLPVPAMHRWLARERILKTAKNRFYRIAMRDDGEYRDRQRGCGRWADFPDRRSKHRARRHDCRVANGAGEAFLPIDHSLHGGQFVPVRGWSISWRSDASEDGYPRSGWCRNRRPVVPFISMRRCSSITTIRWN